MDQVDCPFQTAEKVIETLRQKAMVIVVDFHAEATSEKQAMGWFLDGRVSAVIGTHTHVQTADERILTKGTAYIAMQG
jgi:calcineurin-like phosphoesterase